METYTLEKIKTLTKAEVNKIRKANKSDATNGIKKIIGIPEDREYGIGDTMVRVGFKTEENELFQCKMDDRTFYYVIACPVDNEFAFCFSFYPITHYN